MKIRVPFIYFLVYPIIHVSRAADSAGRDRISVIWRAITLSALLAATARWPEDLSCGYRANESEHAATPRNLNIRMSKERERERERERESDRRNNIVAHLLFIVNDFNLVIRKFIFYS